MLPPCVVECIAGRLDSSIDVSLVAAAYRRYDRASGGIVYVQLVICLCRTETTVNQKASRDRDFTSSRSNNSTSFRHFRDKYCVAGNGVRGSLLLYYCCPYPAKHRRRRLGARIKGPCPEISNRTSYWFNELVFPYLRMLFLQIRTRRPGRQC